MKICCLSMKYALQDKIIVLENDRCVLIDKNDVNDGDGCIDTIVDTINIYYCPFCGKKLQVNTNV